LAGVTEPEAVPVIINCESTRPELMTKFERECKWCSVCNNWNLSHVTDALEREKGR
jgi:hypothetical protein